VFQYNATTATLTTVLLKKGLRNCWIRHAGRCAAGQPRASAAPSRCASCRCAKTWPRRPAGPTRSARAPPSRPCPKGVHRVVDAMGVTDAGIFGDILCARMARRGVAALLTDGVVRDQAGVLATGLPVWCQGTRRRRRWPG
jgi:hypothetical protein